MLCRINDSEIHYHVRGEGRPLLMLHGSLVDHRSILALDAVFEHFPGWQRIYPDLPGMGRSKAGSIGSTDDMLEVVSGFVDQVIGPKNFSVFGYSYGGYLAQGLARERGAQIDGLGLLAPTVEPDMAARNLAECRAIVRDNDFLASLQDDKRVELETFCVVQTQAVWQRTQDELQVGRDIADMAFIERLLANYGFAEPITPLPVPFEQPTMIVTGRQDNVVGYKDTLALLDSYPRATFAVLDRAAHNPQIEQNQLLHALFSDWLERIIEAG